MKPSAIILLLTSVLLISTIHQISSLSTAHTRSAFHQVSLNPPSQQEQQTSNTETNEWIDMPASADVNNHNGNVDTSDSFRFEEARHYSDGCLDMPFAICVGDGKNGGATPIAANAVHKGLVGLWNFDDSAAQDISGNMNQLSPPPSVGPGFGGRGASAMFNGSTLHTIQHISAYASHSFVLSFWLFLTQDAFGSYRTIVHKGTDKSSSPSIRLIPDSRRLHVAVSTTDEEVAFESRSIVPLRRWTHIAYVQSGRIASLIINGIVDVERILPSPGPVPNREPIYVGRDPWRLGVNCYIDDLRIYNRALEHEDIQAIGSTAFPDTGSHYARLGCKNCLFHKAQQSCSSDPTASSPSSSSSTIKYRNYHLCAQNELGAAMTIAASMGWASLDQFFWFSEYKFALTNNNNDDSITSKTGVALCCYDG